MLGDHNVKQKDRQAYLVGCRMAALPSWRWLRDNTHKIDGTCLWRLFQQDTPGGTKYEQIQITDESIIIHTHKAQML